MLINMPTEICEECVRANQHKGKFNKDAGCRTKNQFEVVYSYVCGPMQVDSIGGNKYFVTFIDSHNRKLWTYLINRKDNVFKVFKKIKSMVERQSNHKLKVLKIYGRGEYVSKYFERFCDQEGMVHEVVPSYTP